MRIRSGVNYLVLLASVKLIAGPAISQTCDSLLGAPIAVADENSQQISRASPSYAPQGNSDWRLGSGSSVGGLGSGLSSRDDQPGTFGAITFGGGRATCSGPFRSRNC